MELKTQIRAEEGRQELFITRSFELPVDLLFRAYVEPELVAQWMGTKVVTLDQQAPGAYHFETTDPRGQVHVFSGTIHRIETDKAIIRTFEMVGTGFPVQLEYLDFVAVDADNSRLTMQIVYKSVADRDAMLKLPFAQGINHAHNRLQQIFAIKK